MALTAITNDFITKSGIVIEGTAVVTSSTGQSSALQVNAGAAIAKNLIVGTSALIGTTFAVTGATSLTGTLTANNTSTFNAALIVSGTNTLTVGTGLSTFAGAVSIAGASTLLGTLTANGISTHNAALIVSGTNTFSVGTGVSSFGGIVSISNVTPATTVGAGALVVAGGVFVGNNLVIGSATSSTGIVSNNALYIAGGAGIAGSMVVSGAAVFKDTVTFNGTATYVYSTNTVYTDNILELHTPPDGMNSAWTINDAKDIGIRMHYFDTSDKNAFFGRTAASGYFEYFSAGVENATSFAGATYGVIKAGTFIANDTTAATNATSGALQVLGGAGIGGAIYAGANISGATVTARNLTDQQVVFSDAVGLLSGHAGITYNQSTGILTTTVTSAITSTNLTSGAAGSLPYQLAAGSTSFLPIGNNGYVLTSSGSAPAWTPVTGLSAGNATTATNIAGGLAYQIPYQSAPGSTVFSGSLTYTPVTSTLSVPIISVSAVTGSTSVSTGALVVAGGVGIAGTINVGGKLVINDSTDATSISTGAIIATGGVGISKNLVVGGAVSIGTPVASTVIPSIISNNMQLASFTKTGIIGSAPTTLDTYDATVYRSARYTIQIVDSGKVHVTEITLLHNGIDVYINEYGISTSAGELGAFNASFATNTVTLLFTPSTATSMTIKVVRMCITL
jgi:hypothetical protein